MKIIKWDRKWLLNSVETASKHLEQNGQDKTSCSFLAFNLSDLLTGFVDPPLKSFVFFVLVSCPISGPKIELNILSRSSIRCARIFSYGLKTNKYNSKAFQRHLNILS